MNYIEKRLAGIEVDIDDEIDAWHASANKNVLLHDWLGLSYDEFVTFVRYPNSIDYIVNERKYDKKS